MIRLAVRVSLSFLLSASLLLAQARNEREATVGMRAYVEQIVLQGSELVAAPTTTKSPVVVRVVKTWPHGEHLRYDLEWVGLEPGTYDLSKYLVRKDGSEMAGVPAIEVEVASVLPPNATEPSDLKPADTARLGGYSTLQIVAGVLWGLGLLAILFVGRKRKAKPAPPVPKPTLADRLRPLVEEVASGNADNSKKAELERLLVAFWRARLKLDSGRAVDAIVAIRNHPEAGALLRQVEAWLHAPEPPKTLDVAALLQPYRAVTADSFAPVAAGFGPMGDGKPADGGAS